MDFYITDVFGQTKYSGNQLATFLHCAGLSSEEMQHIAREINFSETTFVLTDTPSEQGYDVRIFTPHAEIPFAGHPTLGTAYIVRHHIVGRPAAAVTINLAAGKIRVSFSENGGDPLLWMRQSAPEFGAQMNSGAVAQTLGLQPHDLDSQWPVQQVSTGLPHIVVPLRSREALKRARVVRTHLDTLIRDTWAKSILVFAPPGYLDDQALAVRVFADYYGIVEDPATGSGNGCLAAYLLKHRYFDSSSIDLLTGQGYEIGRPSILALRATEENGRYSIDIGGRVIPVASGRWL